MDGIGVFRRLFSSVRNGAIGVVRFGEPLSFKYSSSSVPLPIPLRLEVLPLGWLGIGFFGRAVRRRVPFR